ncbi:hypothetical protein [Anaerospora hongkongensis]|uniref:hypothetical protein n=1 Tax=Anaerospora hongkongensis TaxID=244830 RepID=UPI002FDB4775
MSKYPSFGKSLATHALLMYFKSNEIPKIKTEIEQFEIEHGDIGQRPFIKKLYLKLQKNELNNIMIRSVLLGLPDLKRKFVEEKYKSEKTWTAMSLNLHTSKPQLNIWHNEIIQTIANSMKYKIDTESIFCREKIVNMILLLEQQIEMLEKNYAELVDPEIVAMLASKKRRYADLHNDINTRIENAIDGEKKILLIKMEMNHASLQQISQLCDVTEGWVSRCLSNYRRALLSQTKYQELFCVHNEHKAIEE